ncbi:MAG: DUF177 domain-containing protein [Rhodospirillales bacterium]|nr:DUF177 domain-containing protein [Rhodospirillales bacterium]
MTASTKQQGEFSRPLPADRIGAEEVEQAIEATAEERAALARRFDLLALDHLTARLTLRRLEGRPLIRVRGDFEAELTQACVVTLEPVPSRPGGSISLLFSLAPELEGVGGEVFVDLDAEDPPEPVPPGGIDLGEIVAEQLALALEPYPRAPGAHLETAEWGGAAPEDEDKASPFKVLASLKKPQDDAS